MKNDTRQKLIDITFDEIFTHGYHGASLSTILGKAGINKGSMYHFFNGKKAMALAAVEEKLAKFAPKAEPPYLENFFQNLKAMGEMDLSRGCPLANLIQEMSNIDEDFHALLHRIYEHFKVNAQAIYDAAIEAGEMKPTDTVHLASLTFMIFEGGILGAKIARDSSEYLHAVDALERLVRVA